jgi:hypothetical protein
MGFPHATTQDDEYKGYLIPSGTIVMANIWGMLHDEVAHKNPSTFNPDRFLGRPPERDPGELVFGFGRRVCPGQHIANTTLWLAIAMSLYAFRTSPGKDDFGNVSLPKAEWGASILSILSRPVKFACDVKPRSDQHRVLIESASAKHPTPRSNSDDLLSDSGKV